MVMMATQAANGHDGLHFVDGHDGSHLALGHDGHHGPHLADGHDGHSGCAPGISLLQQGPTQQLNFGGENTGSYP